MAQAVQVWLIASLGTAVSGPFGTYVELDFTTRLVFWGVMIGVTLVLAGSLRAFIFRSFAGWSVWLREACASVAIAPVLAISFWVLAPLILGPAHQPVIQPLALSVYAFLIAVLVALLRGINQNARLASPETQAVSKVVPRLLERLPEELQGEIIRLTGRDHLVEVVTTNGSATIRMRFSDAIAEMDAVEGHCAHRSHWVTRAAISDVEREPSKVFLRLVNGDRVPVSRKYRPGLEEAGIV